MSTKGWPPKRRAEQARRCRKIRPWRNSTGPKTVAGKDAVRLNAVKNGLCSAPVRELRRVLRLHRAFLKSLPLRHCEPEAKQSSLSAAPLDCRVGLRPPRNDDVLSSPPSPPTIYP